MMALLMNLWREQHPYGYKQKVLDFSGNKLTLNGSISLL